MDIAKSIRVALARKGQRQVWLAEQMQCSPSYVGQLVSGKSSPRVGTIERIATIFEMTVSEFIALGEL